MQKTLCHSYAKLQKWTIEKELFEYDADSLNSLSDLREAALNGEFDILLLCEYNNLGRDVMETPFAASWFLANDIEIVSVKCEKRDFEQEKLCFVESMIENYVV